MALGLSLSTLGNLGRVASRGVEQHAQRRQEDAERELTKDMLAATVKADYDEFAGKLRQGFYGNVRPELLNVASQTVSQGLRLKRKHAAELRAEEREAERYKTAEARRIREEERETKRYEDKLAAEENTRQRQKAIDIHNITRDIVSEHNGRITRKDAWPLAAERYEAIMAGEYTPTPPTGKTLIEKKFEDLSKFRGEELETKKKELTKDIREAHYNEEITPNDYEKYIRRLQGHGRGVAFGLGRAGSDIFQGVAGLVPRRFVPTPGPLGFGGALAAGVAKKTLGSAYEGFTAPRIQAPQR